MLLRLTSSPLFRFLLKMDISVYFSNISNDFEKNCKHDSCQLTLTHSSGAFILHHSGQTSFGFARSLLHELFIMAAKEFQNFSVSAHYLVSFWRWKVTRLICWAQQYSKINWYLFLWSFMHFPGQCTVRISQSSLSVQRLPFPHHRPEEFRRIGNHKRTLTNNWNKKP